MSSSKSHPRCGARTRSGHRCRRYVAVDPWTKKLRKRCRLHGGLSTGPKFPDAKERSLAAANAGLARWRERMRAAKAAGLIAKFPCGRKPGPSRQQRELEAAEREEALARARVEREDALAPPRWPARRGGSPLVIDLERLERTFIARLSDHDPPPCELIEEVLGDILQGEERFGRAAGKEERLACLTWAYEDWRRKRGGQEGSCPIGARTGGESSADECTSERRAQQDPRPTRHLRARAKLRPAPPDHQPMKTGGSSRRCHQNWPRSMRRSTRARSAGASAGWSWKPNEPENANAASPGRCPAWPPGTGYRKGESRALRAMAIKITGELIDAGDTAKRPGRDGARVAAA